MAAGRYLGIDLGGTKIEGVVLDERLAPRERVRVATERERGYEHIDARLRALGAEIQRLDG